MNSLYLILDSFNGFNLKSLDIISFLAIFSGIFVIISKNPIISVLFLIGLFLSISIYLITIGLSFIGLSYLLVYVGAVSILFIFILMLIDIRISELQSDTNNSLFLAFLIGIIFYNILNKVLPFSTNMISYNVYNLTDYLSTDIAYVVSNS